jgi:hypothetical protein
VREPDQPRGPAHVRAVAFGVRLLELAEPNRHVAADDDRTPASLSSSRTWSQERSVESSLGGPDSIWSSVIFIPVDRRHQVRGTPFDSSLPAVGPERAEPEPDQPDCRCGDSGSIWVWLTSCAARVTLSDWLAVVASAGMLYVAVTLVDHAAS